MNAGEMTLQNSKGASVKMPGVVVQRALASGLALVEVADGKAAPGLSSFEAIVAGEVNAAQAGAYTVREPCDGLSRAAQDHLDRMAKGVSLVYGLSLSLARAIVVGALLKQDEQRVRSA